MRRATMARLLTGERPLRKCDIGMTFDLPVRQWHGGRHFFAGVPEICGYAVKH
jgi:hypothetical protein